LRIDGYADIARFKFTTLRSGATFLYFNYYLVQDTLLRTVVSQKSDAVIFVCPLPPNYVFYGDVDHSGRINLVDLSSLINYRREVHPQTDRTRRRLGMLRQSQPGRSVDHDQLPDAFVSSAL
jgi:hypothetical protein